MRFIPGGFLYRIKENAMRGHMPFIPLECPSCGTGLRIDSDESAAVCTYCSKPFVVKEAIVKNYIKIVTSNVEDCKDLTSMEFVTDEDVLIRYNGTSGSVVIPDYITAIGSKAFEDCANITEVRLSDSVTEIGDNAFAGCTNLRAVYMPDQAIKIGSYAFSECTGLVALKLPNSAKEIGPYAFSGCFMLSAVCMPSSKTLIDETAFSGDKDVRFEWPEDWEGEPLLKLRIAAQALGGKISLTGGKGQDGGELLYLGISGLGAYAEPVSYNFYTYQCFMNMFSLEANNNDPYLLRLSVDNARMRYEAIEDIQRSYSELIGLLGRADISRSMVEIINIPHFIWKQGKRLNDFKVTDIGVVPVLKLRLGGKPS